MTPVEVKKMSGEIEEFSPHKLKISLKRAGASGEQAEEILQQVKKKLYPNISTRRIYRQAFNLLKRESRKYAANYSLKKAILDLGPSGYFFEKFIAAIFRAKGYQSEVEKTYQGRCVSHEVDVIAENDKERIFMECKFHNSPQKKNDVKTALYVQARHLDLKEGPKTPRYDHFYLVSNTIFSQDAIQYSQCVGLKLIGLNTPQEETLHDMIRNLGLHPLTCLKKLRVRDKVALMKEGVVLCHEILLDKDILERIGLDKSHRTAALNEIRAIINGNSKVED